MTRTYWKYLSGQLSLRCLTLYVLESRDYTHTHRVLQEEE